MAKKLEDINQNIAHIEIGGRYFQELNESGDDWDEEKTVQAIKDETGGIIGWFKNLLGL